MHRRLPKEPARNGLTAAVSLTINLATNHARIQAAGAVHPAAYSCSPRTTSERPRLHKVILINADYIPRELVPDA
jgi:hypothetical protein